MMGSFLTATWHLMHDSSYFLNSNSFFRHFHVKLHLKWSKNAISKDNNDNLITLNDVQIKLTVVLFKYFKPIKFDSF